MSKQVVLDFFSAETEEQCGHRIYKYTDCGAWIEFNDKGIKIGSIVEGCDFGTVIYTLNYADNFNSKDIQDRIDAVESEADALWIWANAMNDGEEDTQAELGVDAPDISYEFRHYENDGRSS